MLQLGFFGSSLKNEAISCRGRGAERLVGRELWACEGFPPCPACSTLALTGQSILIRAQSMQRLYQMTFYSPKWQPHHFMSTRARNRKVKKVKDKKCIHCWYNKIYKYIVISKLYQRQINTFHIFHCRLFCCWSLLPVSSNLSCFVSSTPILFPLSWCTIWCTICMAYDLGFLPLPNLPLGTNGFLTHGADVAVNAVTWKDWTLNYKHEMKSRLQKTTGIPSVPLTISVFSSLSWSFSIHHLCLNRVR